MRKLSNKAKVPTHVCPTRAGRSGKRTDGCPQCVSLVVLVEMELDPGVVREGHDPHPDLGLADDPAYGDVANEAEELSEVATADVCRRVQHEDHVLLFGAYRHWDRCE